MFRKINYLIYVFFFFIVGCNSSENPLFYTTKNGLKYEYHEIITDGKKPQIGDFLNMYMELKSLNDSIYYSSLNNRQFGIESFRLKASNIKGGVHEGFLSIMEGDSVTFYINPVDFFKYYSNSNPPIYINKNEEIKITIRLINIKDSIAQIEFKKEQLLKLAMKEEYIIEEVLEKWNHNYDTILKYGDVFIAKLNSMNQNQIDINGSVKVHYAIKLHNKDSIYSNFLAEPHEFDMEVEGQMLPGFKYIIQQLKYGDHVMALVPSYLCFGNKGSVDGKVPPYSPLIFEIMVLE